MKIFNREGVSIIIYTGDGNSPFLLERFASARAKITEFLEMSIGKVEYLRTKAKYLGAQILRDFGELDNEGIKISIIHGKDEPIVAALAKKGQYDVVIRGHTHKPDIIVPGSKLVINPGEAFVFLTNKRRVAILDTTNIENRDNGVLA